MTITIPINAIQLAPGSTVSIHNLSWQDFEAILADLGEHRRTRLTYYRGTLEIMSPLAIHERPHRIIADSVKAILDAQGRDWEDFGSTTLKRSEIAGVEPDTCLYNELLHPNQRLGWSFWRFFAPSCRILPHKVELGDSAPKEVSSSPLAQAKLT